MWPIAIALLLLVHGLISGAQSFGSFGSTVSGKLANPSWLSWWPTKMGQSWLLTTLGMEYRIVFGLVGLLWLVAMICFVAAGFGLLGIVVPHDWWRGLPSPVPWSSCWCSCSSSTRCMCLSPSSTRGS